MAGKSQMIEQLIKYDSAIFTQKFDHIILCLPNFHNSTDYKRADYLRQYNQNLETHVGLPANWEDYATAEEHTLCVIDDMTADMYSDPQLLAAITAHSHHLNISFMMTSQNFFLQGKFSTTIRANCSDLIFMEDRGNPRILKTLGSQVFPATPYILNEAMKFCVEHFPRGVQRAVHLEKNPLSDLPASLRVRTNFVPDTSPELFAGPIYFTTQE